MPKSGKPGLGSSRSHPSTRCPYRPTGPTLNGPPDPHFAARHAAARCADLYRQGRHAQAQMAALAALPALASPLLAAERHETLRLLTLASCEAADFEAAFDSAHRLVHESAEHDDAGLALTAAFCLACCFERMGDSWQSVRVLAEALERHGDGAPPRPHLLTVNGVCAISIGNWHRIAGVVPASEAAEVLARARRAGETALALLPLIDDPAYEVAVRGNLAEVLLHLNEHTAAERLLADAERRAAEHGLHAHGWRVATTRADALLAQGRPADALARMVALINLMGDAAPLATEIRARHAAYRACRSLGRFDEALAHFERVEQLERRRAVTQLRAQSELFVTRVEAEHAQWQADQARQEAHRQSERAAEYKRRAEQDALTGLGNRHHFERRMAELLPTLARDQVPVALAQLDIDHFKRINDEHGHDVGDAVLVGVAQMLRENTRGADVLVRHGGEEFVVVLPGMAPERAVEVCERLRDRVAQAAWPGLAALRVTVSIGLACTPPHDAQALLKRADDALYRAKRAGRNRLELAAEA